MTPPERPSRARAHEILAELAEIGYALPGSIVHRTTSCGRANCHCRADPPTLHGPYLSWIHTSEGKPITRKLTAEQEQHYRPWFDNSRRLQELITELHALSVQAVEEAERWPSQRRSGAR